jgi:hypothetical protein
MKSLLTIALILGSLNAFSAVDCEKQDGRWYPKNELSKDIANKLGVKTCSGKRFKAVVAALGETTNVEASKGSMDVEDVVASIKGTSKVAKK